MRTILLAMLVSTVSAMVRAGDPNDVYFVDASIEFTDATILGAHMLDIDSDGEFELVMVTRSRELDQRELRFYRFRGAILDPTPFRTVAVLEDIIAFGFADVRQDPGKELLFLTRTGAWSYSLEREGYRDNIERFVEADLLYDVPDADNLAYWEYVLPRPDGDWLLLPSVEHAVLWQPDPEWSGEGSSMYREAARIDPATLSDEPKPRSQRGVSFGSGGFSLEKAFGRTHQVLLPEQGERSGVYLADRRSYRAPALADANGDGERDLIVWTGSELVVYLTGEAGLGAEPDRVEAMPEYLKERVDEIERVVLHDIDHDGDVDLLVLLEEDEDGIKSRQISLYVLRNDGQRLLPDEPDQLLRFEAVGLGFEVADVDGDGRDDLAVRKLELPGLWDSMTGLDFELTHLVFLGGEGRRPFSRKADFRAVEKFDESTIESAVANRHLTHDLSGDGIADLVEIDLRGRISIRRLRLESGFFGGESWELDETPWKRFETKGSIDDLVVRDWNGDGIGDVLSLGGERLTLLISQVARARSGR